MTHRAWDSAKGGSGCKKSWRSRGFAEGLEEGAEGLQEGLDEGVEGLQERRGGVEDLQRGLEDGVEGLQEGLEDE